MFNWTNGKNIYYRRIEFLLINYQHSLNRERNSICLNVVKFIDFVHLFVHKDLALKYNCLLTAYFEIEIYFNVKHNIKKELKI